MRPNNDPNPDVWNMVAMKHKGHTAIYTWLMPMTNGKYFISHYGCRLN